MPPLQHNANHLGQHFRAISYNSCVITCRFAFQDQQVVFVTFFHSGVSVGNERDNSLALDPCRLHLNSSRHSSETFGSLTTP
jgi:hypothetical protein